MIRINLLPFRAARKKENIRRQVSVFLLSVVLILIVLGWIHFYLQSKQKMIATDVADVKKELELYRQKDREIQELRKKLNTLNQRKSVIEGLEAKRFKPVHILDQLTQKVIADRMWLNSLALKGNRLDLSGIAVDNNTVANFMDNLETIPKMNKPKMGKNDAASPALYDRVRLASVQQESVRSINMKSFQMVALEKQPPQKKPAKK